ncbi:HDIG domain-containing protein [bacterium]|nr:HDIG domain-containing protein [bacterium]
MNREKFKHSILNHFYALIFGALLGFLQLSHNLPITNMEFIEGSKAPINIVMPPFTGFKSIVEGESLTGRYFWIIKGEILSKSKIDSIQLVLKKGFPIYEILIYGFLFYLFFLFFLTYIGRKNFVPFRKKMIYFLLTLLVAIFAKFTASFSTISIYYLPFIGLSGLYLIFFEKNTAIALSALQSVIISVIYLFNPYILFALLTAGFFSMLFYRKDVGEATFVNPFIIGTIVLSIVVTLFNFLTHRPLVGDLIPILWTTIALPIFYITIQLLKVYSTLFPRYNIMSYLNLDHPLLKMLRDKAPGTYQHSLAMANLAETCAAAIGANGLLCRVGAYYHDIGKTVYPQYFIENQNGENPHDLLEPEESARMIRLHVSDGMRMAQEYRLPDYISQFIDKHHGSTLLEFFYEKSKEKNGEITTEGFRYPGRKPDTKETAILMIVDAIEAASRTLKDPNLQKIEALVTKIIFSKILYNQLTTSSLTLAELRKIALTLIDSIKNNAHVRIEYPWQKEDKKS